jgi:hypothetical protein
MAGPGAQKNFDPEHPLVRDSKGRSLALFLYSCLLQVFLFRPPSHYVSRTHCRFPAVPPRLYVFEYRGGKRSKVSPRGALNLPAARFLQTERFDPLSPPRYRTFSVRYHTFSPFQSAVPHFFGAMTPRERERERERERALLGTTFHTRGSRTAPAARTAHHHALFCFPAYHDNSGVASYMAKTFPGL